MSEIPGFIQIGNTVDIHPKSIVTVERCRIKDPSTGNTTYCLKVSTMNGRTVSVTAEDEDGLMTMHSDLAKAMGGEQ